MVSKHEWLTFRKAHSSLGSRQDGNGLPSDAPPRPDSGPEDWAGPLADPSLGHSPPAEEAPRMFRILRPLQFASRRSTATIFSLRFRTGRRAFRTKLQDPCSQHTWRDHRPSSPGYQMITDGWASGEWGGEYESGREITVLPEARVSNVPEDTAVPPQLSSSN